MIQVTVEDKRFGRNFILFSATNLETGEVIKQEKYKKMHKVSEETFNVINEYGQENVQIRHK